MSSILDENRKVKAIFYEKKVGIDAKSMYNDIKHQNRERGELMDLKNYTVSPLALGDFHNGSGTDVWKLLGCHEVEPGVHEFAVWAPNARRVSLVGDFNDWDHTRDPMDRLPDGTWAIRKVGMEHSALYKYWVLGADGKEVLKIDPFASHCETGPATASRVWSLDGYEWKDGAFLKQRAKKNIFRSPMSIYELHLGSWKRAEEGIPSRAPGAIRSPATLPPPAATARPRTSCIWWIPCTERASA